MASKQQGLTLIELITVIAIIGILAGVAWPIYQDTSRRGKREEAIRAVLNAKAQLEKCYSKTRDFSDTVEAACTVIPTSPITFNSDKNNYQLAVTKGVDTYTITATATGVQANDNQCLVFSLSQNGDKTGSTNSSCWPQ
jgi:type IV pilus assembly protein PilE